MDDQHKLIKGYRDLSQAEIDLINEAKNMAEQVGCFVEKLYYAQVADPRWVSIARTDLQTGFMAVIRSIAKPTTF